MSKLNIHTPIEGEGYGTLIENTKLKKGLSVRINKKTFTIGESRSYDLKCIESLTTTLIQICRELEQEGRLTNLFGKPIKWDK